MDLPTCLRLALQSAEGPGESAFEIGMAEPDQGCLGPRFAHGLACALPMEDTPGHCDT